MNVKLIMEDVHKHVITLMDLISVPVGMDMSWLVMVTIVLVSKCGIIRVNVLCS